MSDMYREGGGPVTGLTKSRVEVLTDGIFAFAMTLLVTTMDYQNAGPGPFPALTASSLVALYFPDLLHYVIAFLTLAGFWIEHHIQFSYIRSIDQTFLGISIISLLFVALIPFSTALAGDYPDTPLAAVVFDANLLAIGVTLFLTWNYATTDRRLVDKSLAENVILINTRRAVLIPAISSLAFILALLGVTWSTWIYLVAIPGLVVILERPFLKGTRAG
ncbi:MAG TPA: TMEM175 family protein [Methanomicrobiales archaeon]|jgi:uncharacterized membrane protein|nr:TMEM175 family protein [Methanomicrobiales archaeon]